MYWITQHTDAIQYITVNREYLSHRLHYTTEGLCNIGYPPESHLKFKSGEITFVHNICFSCPVGLKFCMISRKERSVGIQSKSHCSRTTNVYHAYHIVQHILHSTIYLISELGFGYLRFTITFHRWMNNVTPTRFLDNMCGQLSWYGCIERNIDRGKDDLISHWLSH